MFSTFHVCVGKSFLLKFYKRTVAPTTAMVDNRCPVRLQTQVTGEDAGTDSVGDDFIKEAKV